MKYLPMRRNTWYLPDSHPLDYYQEKIARFANCDCNKLQDRIEDDDNY